MSQNQPTITEVRTEGLRTRGEHYRKVEQTTTVDGIAYSRWAGRQLEAQVGRPIVVHGANA